MVKFNPRFEIKASLLPKEHVPKVMEPSHHDPGDPRSTYDNTKRYPE